MACLVLPCGASEILRRAIPDLRGSNPVETLRELTFYPVESTDLLVAVKTTEVWHQVRLMTACSSNTCRIGWTVKCHRGNVEGRRDVTKPRIESDRARGPRDDRR